MRRRSSADARPVGSSRDAGLAKIMPGRKARFAGKEPLGEETLIVAGLKEHFRLALLEDGGPLTDNVVLNSAQRVFVLKRTAVL
ncbi:hypothetical protein Y697_14025 [Mesotoga sp. BH458_6_3_2_1]|nr:hypothetical protein Y697_14025 [Mesotoga sp. BH458_6_3_2_1]